MNEEKTRIAYCKGMRYTSDEPITSFDFLGYTFAPSYFRCKDGRCRLCFIPRVSKRKEQDLRDTVKKLKLHLMSGSRIEQIAEILNPIVRGWTNYFKRFCPSAMRNALRYVEERIIQWAMRKYKTLKGKKTRARQWLQTIRKQQPELFEHWKYLPAW